MSKKLKRLLKNHKIMKQIRSTLLNETKGLSMKFKVGDRVAVYVGLEPRKTGTIIDIFKETSSYMIEINSESRDSFHEKQCRKLVKKKGSYTTSVTFTAHGLDVIDCLSKKIDLFERNFNDHLEWVKNNIRRQDSFNARFYDFQENVYKRLRDLEAYQSRQINEYLNILKNCRIDYPKGDDENA